MNKRELLKIHILQTLQRRDALFLPKSEYIIYYRKKYSFFDFAYLIGIKYKDNHDIPIDYLQYYIKEGIFNYNKLLINKAKRNRILAGGSLAKTYLKVVNGKKLVIKEGNGGAGQKIKNEINYFLKLGKNINIKKFLPEIIEYKIKPNYSKIILKYYEYNTFSYNLLFGIYNINIAKDKLISILDIVKNNIWDNNLIFTFQETFIQEFYFKRLENNNNILSTNLIFKKLLNYDYVFINGKKYLNLNEIIKKILLNKDIINKLSLLSISTIWGDFHLNNILINRNDIIFIDNRGNDGDYMYDLCKIYHTVGPGRYDFIDNDLISCQIIDNRIERNFLINHPSWEIYNELEKHFLLNLNNYIYDNDINAKIRFHFLNFFIYATMPLFLLKNDGVEERALMGYSNAIIFGNIFLDMINTGNYDI